MPGPSLLISLDPTKLTNSLVQLLEVPLSFSLLIGFCSAKKETVAITWLFLSLENHSHSVQKCGIETEIKGYIILDYYIFAPLHP